MTKEKNILLPSPVIDSKEDASIKKLCERYEKLVTPGVLAKAGKKQLRLSLSRLRMLERWLKVL